LVSQRVKRVKMLKRLIVSFVVIGTFSVAGVLYKNDRIEDAIKSKIDHLKNIKYKNVYCIGVKSTTCFISDIEFLEGNKTTAIIDKAVIDDIEKLNGLDKQDINGTFPFAIALENVQFLDIPQDWTKYAVDKDIEKGEKFSVRAIGEFSRRGGDEVLKLDELSIDSDMVAVTLNIDIKRDNELIFLAKEVGLSIIKGNLLHKAYLSLDDKNISEDIFLSTLAEELSKPLIGKIEIFNSLARNIQKFVKDKNSSKLVVNIKSKDGSYINLYKVLTTYNLFYMLDSFDLLNGYIDNTFTIDMGVK